MIMFDGIDFEDVAPVKIEDIRVSPIATNPIVRQRLGFGQDLIRVNGSNRTVTITFALQTDDQKERFQQLQKVMEWAKPYTEHDLSLPMYDDRHLECMCTQYPEPSYRQWWESKLRLVFTTFGNPYWTADDENKAQCGSQMSIGGTAQPLMRIERKLMGRIADQTYSANGRSMFFSIIPAGDMLIDLNKQTAEISGSSFMQYFGKTSKFIEPVVGNMVIAGTGTVVYRERWVN